MHHLFLKLTPEFIGRSPFVPGVHNSMDVKARDVGLTTVNPSGYVHMLPLEAGYVGADNVGVLIASEIYKSSEVSLVIDIGTNGELVLGNNEKMFSVSCAAGPALEGAHIKFGMRAAAGAIERVKIDNFEPTNKTIGDEKPRGICGSGIIDVIAELFHAGIIEKNGRFADLDIPRLRKTNKVKEYVLEYAPNAAINTDIVITQKDVREVQLAKAAMYAGAVILMNKFGCKKLDRIMLAGAFGNYIDKKSAMLIGLYPDCDLERVVSIGNAAGEGAIMALLSKEKREEAKRIARAVEYVELTLEKEFEPEFMNAMYFPHRKDSFPHLKEILD
jgi:uncharacterized 2Fe-2S/4Fe-4S cluster protein (DUF4445 family)